MERVLTSFRFLASTAVCCGLAVALAAWAVSGSSGSARVLAALIGLGSSLAVMLLIAWAASAEEVPAVHAPAPIEPVTLTPAASEVQVLLRERLDEGRALEPDPADPRVDAWIAGVRQTIELHKPGLLGYFDALSQRAYADDRARLDAYVRRLATIVRDLI